MSVLQSKAGPRAAAIGAAVLALDQLTKAAISAWLPVGESHRIIAQFFDLTHVTNSGAAWGIFRGKNELLEILSIVTVLAILLFRRSLALHAGQTTALSLVTGGILGNFLDRVRFGAVVDFLDFYIRDWHWPAFNVADCAICCGVGLYMLATFRAEKSRPPDPPAASATPPSKT